MIVNVGLSPAALLDISQGRRGRDARALRQALVDGMRSHGTLVLSSAAERSELIELVKSGNELTEAEREAWRDLLLWLVRGERIRIATPAYVALGQLQAPTDTDSITHRPFIGVVPDAVFDRLFPDSEDGLVLSSDAVEMAVSATASTATLFATAKELAAQERYDRGANREQVWEEVLRPLATQSKRVTVFDRFGLAELHRREHAHNAQPEHLEWLLNKLNDNAPVGTLVKVYASTGYSSGKVVVPPDPARSARILESRWRTRPNRLSGVELITLPGTHSLAHDRHLAFGETTALKLSAGLDRLAWPTLRDAFTFAYFWHGSQLEALRKDVSAVEQRRPTVTKLVL